MPIDKTESAQGFQRPKTTRRYLQGPLAERLIVFYREGKIVHGEMCHEKDWHRWKYVCQPAMGVWLVHGDGDESFDFRTARLRVDPEGVPIHGQSWRVGGMEVDLEACSPVERVPSAHVRLRVSNRGEAPIDEKIGFVVRNSQEKMLVQASPDIYRIYNPRVRTWKGLECEWRREGDVLSLQDLFVSFRGDAPAEWDVEEGTVRFRAALAPGETKTWELALGRRPEPVAPGYDAAAARTREDWRGILARVKGRSLMEKCLVAQILQCYARANATGTILPRQGGLQRWVWPWDQSYASAALTMLGYGEYVEMACDFYFGEYAQPSGEIGPFGNGWVNDTANVLGIFSRHCFETGDAAYWRRHRDDAERAFRWIAARRVKPGDPSGDVPGLFPAGQSTDDPFVFQAWGTTDLLNLQGLELFARAARKFGDPAADAAEAEAADYRAAISRILDKWRKASEGKDVLFIPFKPDGSDEQLLRDRNYYYMHPSYFAALGFLDGDELVRVRRGMLRDGYAAECGLYFRQPMPGYGRDDHVWYTTAAEYDWFFAWLRAGRDDLAAQALDAAVRYGMTEEFMVGERFHDANPWFLPWSPNASGSGRILLMLDAMEKRVIPERLCYTSRADGAEDWFMLRDAGPGSDCLVYLHGHGSDGNQLFTRKDVMAAIPLVAAKGLSVVAPNLRGNAWMCPSAVQDLADLLAGLREKRKFRRYVVIGGSMGGTGALVFAMRHPDLVDALGIMGGVTSLRRYREWLKRGTLPVHREILAAVENHYRAADYEAHDVAEHCETLAMPLVFAHGGADEIMPVSEMEDLRSRMAGRPNARFEKIPGGDHDSPLSRFASMLDELTGNTQRT